MGKPAEFYVKKLTFALGEGENKVPRWVYTAQKKAKKNCLIDRGTAGNFDEAVQFCEEHGVGIGDLDFVVNTHCHPDHIGGNLLFKRANPDIVFCAHPLAAIEIEDVERQFHRRPLPGFHQLVAGPVAVDRRLEDRDRLDIGETVQVLHTPGHSSGSISLHLPHRDLLIIGDSIPGRTDVPIYEDVVALRSTIDRLERVGAANVISAFDGDCGPISEVAYLGRGILEKVERAVREYLAQLPAGQEPDATMACRYVLDNTGFAGVTALPIITTSIIAHMTGR